MKIKFIYSPFEEIKESLNMVIHKSDYNNLRSVVWPSFFDLVKYAVNHEAAKMSVESMWNNSSANVERGFKDVHLKNLGDVTCYLHGISCEGWFDTDNNSIHIRTVESGGEEELLKTIIHELLHLATYNKQMTYEDRENLVEKYLNLPQFKKAKREKKMDCARRSSQ